MHWQRWLRVTPVSCVRVRACVPLGNRRPSTTARGVPIPTCPHPESNHQHTHVGRDQPHPPTHPHPHPRPHAHTLAHTLTHARPHAHPHAHAPSIHTHLGTRPPTITHAQSICTHAAANAHAPRALERTHAQSGRGGVTLRHRGRGLSLRRRRLGLIWNLASSQLCTAHAAVQSPHAAV